MDFITLGADIRSSEQLILAVLLFFGCAAYARGWRWGWLIGAAVAVRIMIPMLLSFLQWQAWSAPGHGLTRLFLPPHQPITYFLQYCWTAFFYRQVLSLMFAAAIAVCARALMQYREGAMLPEEVGMVTFSVLILGWPVALLVPFATIIMSALALVIKKVFVKEAKMSIGLWSLVSCVGLLMWGEELMRMLQLQVLFIGR